VRGNEFLHPLLRFAVKFPEGWELTNTAEAVLAQEPGTDHFMVLQEVEQPRGRSLGDAAVAAMRSAGYTVVDGRIEKINGHDAHVGLYRGNAKDVGKVLMRAAHIAIGGKKGSQNQVHAWFAFDQKFSPRRLGLGLPFLSCYY
jgi:predicted Zn-dependent protease